MPGKRPSKKSLVEQHGRREHLFPARVLDTGQCHFWYQALSQAMKLICHLLRERFRNNWNAGLP